MRTYLVRLVICLFFIGSICCSPAKKKGDILTRKGEKLELIDSLTVYNVEQDNYSKLTEWLKPGQRKIVVSVDAAACFSCSDDFVIWKDIISEAKNKNITFLFYLHTLDFEKIKPYFRKWRFYYPVIIDKKNQFYDLNGLIPEKKYRAMILDADNRLQYVGNPLYSQDYNDYYAKLLKE